VQRGGPSTGIPTKSEQSDLFQAAYAGHGDEPRVVLSCGDVGDTYHATVDAFNIAEEFQVPVIVLSDQLIAQRRETIEVESLTHPVVERRLASRDELQNYRRYKDTEDGVSPMTVPGMPGGTYQTNGLEHDERGRPSSMFVVHDRMNAKRYRKLAAISEKYRLFRRYGAPDPDLGILCWGSSEGAVREAITRVDCERGIRVAAFVPQLLVQLPVVEIQEFIDSCKEILVIELSHAAQFHQFLRAQVDLPRGRTHVYARSGGKLLGVGEVLRQIERVLAPADKL